MTAILLCGLLKHAFEYLSTNSLEQWGAFVLSLSNALQIVVRFLKSASGKF
jgi:hypothetical protein